MRTVYITLISCIFLFSINGLISGCKNGRNQVQVLKDSVVTKLPAQYSFYLDNSMSMDGYMDGNGSYKTLIDELLIDLSSNPASSPKLFYVNTQAYPVSIPIAGFSQHPAFKDTGDRGNSKLDSIFSVIIRSSKPSNVSILITDGIYSIDKVQGQNEIESKLRSAASVTRGLFNQAKVIKPYVSVCVIKCKSRYVGTYYSESNKLKLPLTGQERPYYIWLFGDISYIDEIVTKLKLRQYANADVSVEDICYFQNNISDKINYQITTQGMMGKYRPDNNLKGLHDAIKDRSGKFHFSVLADFSNLRVDNKYILDKLNYSISSGYTLFEIKRDSNNANFSYLLTLETDALQTGDVRIILKNKMPGWVINTSSKDDSNILAPDQLNTTFGLKYLMDALFNAYNSRDYATINVKVDTGKSSSPFSVFWWILILILIIALVWYLKNKK